MLFYTWKDIERCLFLNKDKWDDSISDIEVYASDMIVYVSTLDSLATVKKNLADILEYKYAESEDKIFLDLGKDYSLTVFYEIQDEKEPPKPVVPLFRDVLYQKSAYYEDMVNKQLPGCPVIAFDSYKGGVGRTLSLLAFVKAWSSLADVSDTKKLLIVDSDIEAPGITWMTLPENQRSFSYLDLLEVTQRYDNVEEIVNLVAEKIKDSTVLVETDVRLIEHIVLPTYRYMEQLLDMYASPESIVSSYNKKFILAEVLSKLGETLNAAAVLVDLRAGVSEFSAPILFDPRVKKYLVTSTSYQSVKGTELLIQELNKGLPIRENILLPEIFLTMIPEGFYTTDIISDLISIYDDGDLEKDSSLTDHIVTELPFASELLHLGGFDQTMRCLEGTAFYKNIFTLVKDNYISADSAGVPPINRREDLIQTINKLAYSQLNAEGNTEFNVLMTPPINNLIKKYRKNIPHTVMMGAKGSGKTFLYREILRSRDWEMFAAKMEGQENLKTLETNSPVIPVLASANAGFEDILSNAVKRYNLSNPQMPISASVWIDNRDRVRAYNRDNHDTLEWNKFWKKLILQTLGNQFSSLDELNQDLGRRGERIVLLFDGLEEIFQKTLSAESEKYAIVGLCQDLLSDLRIKYSNIGSIIFLRKDLARNSIEVNFEQFNTQYSSVELNWSGTEALRLAVWLVNQAVPGFYQEKINIELASRDIIERNLTKLWGLKLGKSTSNEAYSSRWILAALSDFNGQLQARDIIRFLQYATEDLGRPIYEDRYIMPAEIKKAVPKCSSKKLDEIKQEIASLKPVFDKLDQVPEDKKTLPFYSNTFELTSAEEKLMKQEGYLKVDNDKYYLPEIIRHALRFRYERGARPRVLSLLSIK